MLKNCGFKAFGILYITCTSNATASSTIHTCYTVNKGGCCECQYIKPKVYTEGVMPLAPLPKSATVDVYDTTLVISKSLLGNFYESPADPGKAEMAVKISASVCSAYFFEIIKTKLTVLATACHVLEVTSATCLLTARSAHDELSLVMTLYNVL